MSDKGLDEAAAYLVLPQSQLTKILTSFENTFDQANTQKQTKKSHTQ